jgi:hypothetical protein
MSALDSDPQFQALANATANGFKKGAEIERNHLIKMVELCLQHDDVRYAIELLITKLKEGTND